MRRYLRFIQPMVVSISLAGCGTTIPAMEGIGYTSDEKMEETELVQLVKCELHFGVQEALNDFPASKNPLSGYNVEWLRKWEAKVSMKITVDEKGSLLPGLTWNEPMIPGRDRLGTLVPQSFALSAGIGNTSQATRVETIGFKYAFADLLKEGNLKEDSCRKQISGKIVLDDLKISDFIKNKAYVANHTDAVTQKDGDAPYSTFSDEITFALAYSGNITPTWKLVSITASSSSPLYNAVKTKTHDISITLGKIGNPQADAVANANLIGQAVARAIDH